MPIEPSDLLAESRSLRNSVLEEPPIPATEVKIRASIRLAYYAAYHVGLRKARKDQFDFPESRGAHKELWNDWCRDHRRLDAIYGTAELLKGLRHRADYRLHHQFKVGACTEAIEMAEEIIDGLAKAA